MSAVIDYVILGDEYAENLRKKVLMYLKSGYRLQGGVCNSAGEDYDWFYQAMVKEENNAA